jgi:uncharacterized integral membrane protein (TIGR00698 family)
MNRGSVRVLPGLVVLVVIGLLARALGGVTPFLTPLVFAIAIGVVVANAVEPPRSVRAGINKQSLLLETAIVLLGASLSLDAILAAGPLLVALVVGIVTIGLCVVTVLARAMRLSDRMGALLAAGSSVCGVSAVAAVAPTVDADETQIAHAAATILLFDAATLVIFPAVGRLLELAPETYGVWIGLSMFSTGPVAAAGFAHSEVAGRWATLTKLTRNAMIGVVALSYSLYYTRQSLGSEASVSRVWNDFPTFLVGFLLVAVLANVGNPPSAVIDLISRTSDFLFLLAFAGLGFEIQVDEMQNTGVVPIVVVGTYLVIASLIAYASVVISF